jgi:hypothetical protein
VKELNPGMDMLFAVNWDAHVRGSALADTVLPELTGIGGLEILDVAALEKSAGQVEQAAASRETNAEAAGSTATEPESPDDSTVAQGSNLSASRETQTAATEPITSLPSAASTAAPSAPHVSPLGWMIFLTIAILAAVVVAGSFLMRAR